MGHKGLSNSDKTTEFLAVEHGQRRRDCQATGIIDTGVPLGRFAAHTSY
jgi:hypothetical protein